MTDAVQPKDEDRVQGLTIGQRLYVIKQLGVQTWLIRTRLTKGGAFLTSLGLFAILNAVTYSAFGIVGGTVLVLIAVLASGTAAFGYIMLREEHPARGLRRAATVALLGVLGFVLAPFPVLLASLPAQLSKARSYGVEAAKTKPTAGAVRPIAKNSEEILNSCFVAGKALATVYLGNMAAAAASDLMPSRVMRAGCDEKAVGTPDAASCVYQCELGFRSIARAALR